MGSFIHYCKHCNTKLNVDNAWLGKSMKCPACGKKITFPAEDGSIAQSVPTINLQDLPIPPTQTGNADFPTAPNFSTAPDMPSAPDFKMPDPPATSSGKSKGPAASEGSPRRINLKPLKGINETVPSQPNISLDAFTGEMPVPPDPFSTRTGENGSAPAAVEKVSLNNANIDGSTEKLIVSERKQKNALANDKAASSDGSGNRFFPGTYFWGRLGSASVYILAGLLILAAVYFSLNLYWEYLSAEELIPEKRELAEVNKELNAREKSLSAQFKNAVNLLQGTGNILQSGVLDGLALTEDICRRPDPMPLGLLTGSELKTAQKVLAQYVESNKKIKEEFIKSFGEILLLENSSKNSVSGGSLAQVILQAGEVKKQFYTHEDLKLAQVKRLENSVNQVKKQFAASGSAAQQEALKRFEGACRFVRTQLFPAESNVTVVRASGYTPSAAANNSSSGDMQQAAGLIAALTGGWQLDLEIAGMEMLLEKVPKLSEIYEKKKNAHLRMMGKMMVVLWLRTLMSAFALLVFGDVLRAHFDKADILRRMEGQKEC